MSHRRRYREVKLPPLPTCVYCGGVLLNPKFRTCSACAYGGEKPRETKESAMETSK